MKEYVLLASSLEEMDNALMWTNVKYIRIFAHTVLCSNVSILWAPTGIYIPIFYRLSEGLIAHRLSKYVKILNLFLNIAGTFYNKLDNFQYNCFIYSNNLEYIVFYLTLFPSVMFNKKYKNHYMKMKYYHVQNLTFHFFEENLQFFNNKLW